MSKLRLNIKVMIIDSDFYALRALNSYIAWDRRTRVVCQVQTFEAASLYLQKVAEAEYPDVVLIEPDHIESPDQLREAIRHLRQVIREVSVVCIAHRVHPAMVSAALDAGIQAYLVRNEVGVQIVGALVYAMDHPLTITKSVVKMNHDPFDVRLQEAKVLPRQRPYPEMTERIRQALWLCVVEGMSAQLAADEMGVSPHTIRSYIKEGYRILKAHDDTEYPDDMSPEEQAFMRFTALDEDEAKD
jgi:DNA-binding NarL/FixJ family response regulator